jgi:hypothetical protein
MPDDGTVYADGGNAGRAVNPVHVCGDGAVCARCYPQHPGHDGTGTVVLEPSWRSDLPADLVVGTMCHCGDPDDCSDHWEFFTNAVQGRTSPDHVARGRKLTERQMRAVARLVRGATTNG